MAFPGPKNHRINRRKLGRGQYPTQPNTPPTTAVTVIAISAAGGVTFSAPVATTAGQELSIAGITVPQTNPTFGTAPASRVQVPISWSHGAPTSPFNWTFNGVPSQLTLPAGKTTWYPSGGLATP